MENISGSTQKKWGTNVNGPTHSTVEAGACWVHGWVRGGSLSVRAAEVAARVRFQKEGIAQGVLLWFQYYVRYQRYKVLMRVSAAFYYQNGKTLVYSISGVHIPTHENV